MKADQENFQVELEKLEKEISVLSYEVAKEKKIKKLVRMMCAEEFNADWRKIDEKN